MPRITKYILYLLLILIGSAEFISAQGPLFEVKRLSFNLASSSQIAPVLYKDGIIFCSDRRISSVKQTTTYNSDRLYNIFVAEKKDTSTWSTPREITVSSGSVLYGGPLCFAPDKKTVYFTSAVISGRAAMKRNLKNPTGIYIGELLGSDIINVRPFEYNDKIYNVGHPSISSDGKYLFFASDKAGGQGGSDIYYCELINNKWSAPVNLGSKVNTPSKENYPYMHPSGRLYFSSDRPGGQGGFDIYYTYLSMGTWQDPVALPQLVNSPADDFAFVAEENLQSGYFTSNREKKTEGVYSFSSNIIRKVKCDSIKETLYEWEFFDENALKDDSLSKNFLYRWNFGDGSSEDGVKTVHLYKSQGNYTITLDVINLKTNKIKKAEKTLYLEIKEAEQPYITGPDTCKAGSPAKLDALKTYLPGWDIKQFYWNFGDETVAFGKNVNKTFLKPGSYEVQLIVSANPDAKGALREACVLKKIIVIQ